MRHLIGSLITAALLLPGSLTADVTIEITGGAVGAVPLAVVPFRAAPETGGVDVDIADIVRGDLRRTGLFESLPPENFISQPASSDEVRYQNWRALGADYLVVGSVRGGGSAYDVRFQLMDVYGARVLANRRYTVPPAALRTGAHTIADEVFRTLTGRSGGFNSRMLFVRVEDRGDSRRFRLMFSEADGHNPQPILTANSPIMSPTWSPDRQRLAYVSFEDRRSEIFVQELGSGERRKVASFEGINSAPAFSPDGSQLAVALSRDGSPDIVVLDLADGSTRSVTRSSAIDTEPTWTPDGRHIVFTSDRGGAPQIYRVSARGGDVERLTFEGGYNASPDLSPDGRFLAMVHRGARGFQIAVQDLETGLLRVLTEGELDESPSFSPSGAMLAYSRIRGGRSELATVSLHGRADDTLIRTDDEVREPAWSSE